MFSGLMLSVQSQWCCPIANKEKLAEIRTRFPLGYVGWVFIYCTKEKREDDQLFYLEWAGKSVGYFLWKDIKDNNDICHAVNQKLNGKVIGCFWCDGIEPIPTHLKQKYPFAFEDILKRSCLTLEQFNSYTKGKDAYAIPIDNLEIFDIPKDLSEFYSECDDSKCNEDCPHYYHENNPSYTEEGCYSNISGYKPLTRAPQSYQRIYFEKINTGGN